MIREPIYLFNKKMLGFVRRKRDRNQYFRTNAAQAIIRDCHLPNFLSFPSPMGNSRLSGCILPTHRGGRLHFSTDPGWKHSPHDAAADPRDRVACFQFIFRRLDFPSRPFHPIGAVQKRRSDYGLRKSKYEESNEFVTPRHVYKAYGAIAKSQKLWREEKGRGNRKWLEKKREWPSIFERHAYTMSVE